MSYEPTNWKDGDLVTSAKLNKLEQGVAGAGGESVFFVNMTNNDSGYILDKTAGEIYEAFRNGNVRFIFYPMDGYEVIINLIFCQRTPSGYSFVLQEGSSFYAATADDYPTTEQPTSGDSSDLGTEA